MTSCLKIWKGKSCNSWDLFQACDITGGLYLKIPQKVALAQYLLVSVALAAVVCGWSVLKVHFYFFVWTVGVSAWHRAALPAGAAASCSCGLQSGLFLPPEPHRNRLCLLGLFVQWVPHSGIWMLFIERKKKCTDDFFLIFLKFSATSVLFARHASESIHVASPQRKWKQFSDHLN